MRSALVVSSVFLTLSLTACGLEALVTQGGYHPTPPPEAKLTGKLADFPLAKGGNASAAVGTGGVLVRAYASDGRQLGIASATLGEPFTVSMGSGDDYTNVRLVVQVGSSILKAFSSAAPRAKDPTDVGTIDLVTTAATLLLEQRASDEGGLAGMAPMVAQDLYAQGHQGSGIAPEIDTFAMLVADLESQGDPNAPSAATPIWHDLSPILEQGFIDEYMITDHTVDEYLNALLAAAGALKLDQTCDPALIRVMFTVDTTGQARDGNGARQLIRQPPREGKIFLGITVDDSSPVPDSGGLLKTRLTPNDPDTEMFDDGTNGDEVAGDGVFTRVLTLPRGMRVIYKYTNGSAGDGFTRTEEWPGNARILTVQDLLTRYPDGRPDCLVIRRDAFGDESTNKNHVNLNRQLAASGGNLAFDQDLGGDTLSAPPQSDGSAGLLAGGLGLYDLRTKPGLTPASVAEARENGICSVCPAPLTLPGDDSTPPTVLSANFISTSEIRVVFSEPMDFTSAGRTQNYLIIDDAQRVLQIRGAAASQDRVTLSVGSPDLARRYTLFLRGGASGLTDASKARNPIADGTTIVVGPDVTPPQAIAVRATNRRELNPTAELPDPTTGDVVVVTFNEEMDQASAEDASHYQVYNALGVPISVKAAFLRGRSAYVVTETQEKRRKYNLAVAGVKDLSGNPLTAGDPLPFEGFALYKVVFGGIPGFAFASADGMMRGIPGGENMYLTGTALAVARDLSGTDVSLGGRTDVTGVREFQMTASTDAADQYMSKPTWTLSVLLPPGVYAWKLAHGIEGEWRNPPATLEKVTKSLASTNDATGVQVDPITLKGNNGVDYTMAKLSIDASEPEGPKVFFKRENPDELCDVQSEPPPVDQPVADSVSCPVVLISTWRDLPDFYDSGRLLDYDDGVRTLPTIKPLVPDTFPPELYDVRACDDQTVLLTFSELLDTSLLPGDMGGPSFGIADASGGALAVSGAENPRPHQYLLHTDPMAMSAAYTLTYNGVGDMNGNRQMSALSSSFVAPPAGPPCPEVDDGLPPALVSAVPESPTQVRVRFSKRIAQASVMPASFSIAARDSSSPPTVQDATLAGSGKEVLLTTSPQAVQGQYTLTVRNISDTADPPHVLDMATTDFVGFGDRTPPEVVHAAAISPTQVVVVFSKPMDPATAADATSYAINGLQVSAVEFSGSMEFVSAAFDPNNAPLVQDTALLTTSRQTAGTTYAVSAPGAKDLSGNTAMGMLNVTGAAAAKTVDVVIAYTVSSTTTVAGQLPPRALDPSKLASEREGVFILGAAVSTDGMTQDPQNPVTMTLGGFPAEGAPLDGAEPQLMPSGGVYTIRIPAVPLGTTIEWKGFAPYTVAYKNANPGDSAAAFADATPGPSAYGDGQEYPGNENAVRVLGDQNGDGVVTVNVLFGDETSYKKFTMKPAFRWITDDVSWVP
jgi:hypothetical protein